MKSMLRWLGLMPASLIAFVAVFKLLGLLRVLLLGICPSGDHVTDWTTDLSWPDDGVSIPNCSAPWFPSAELALLLFVFARAVGATPLLSMSRDSRWYMGSAFPPIF